MTSITRGLSIFAGSLFVIGCVEPMPVGLGPPGVSSSSDGIAWPGVPYDRALPAEDGFGAPVAWEMIDGPDGAVVEEGFVLWTPGDSDVGEHTFVTAVATDGPFLPLTLETFVVVVQDPSLWPPDRAPVFGHTPLAGRVEACASLSVSFEARDPDGEPLSFSVRNLPEGAKMRTAGNAGVLEWTPRQDQAGRYLLAIYATDQKAPRLSSVFLWQLDVVGPPPLEIGPVPDALVRAGHTAIIDVPAPVHACYTVSVAGAPDGASLDPATGTLYWRTESDDFGIYEITYVITDSADPPATAKTTGRIAIELLDEFGDLDAYDVTLFHPSGGEGRVEYTTVSRPELSGGVGMHTYSPYGAVVAGLAARALDRGTVPLAGVHFEVGAGQHSGPGCGLAGVFELYAGSSSEPVAVRPLEHGFYNRFSGNALFDRPSTGVTVVLRHLDPSPSCEIEVIWDVLIMTPIPAW
jgi:hypothetical protein